jgi:hypothetical protein
MSAVDDYHGASQKAADAERVVKEDISRLVSAGADLSGNKWKRVHVPGMPGRHLRRATQIPREQLKTWPIWETVCARINEYHAAMLAMDNAYDAMSETERSLIPAPVVDHR